jgi:hypothetical protein
MDDKTKNLESLLSAIERFKGLASLLPSSGKIDESFKYSNATMITRVATLAGGALGLGIGALTRNLVFTGMCVTIFSGLAMAICALACRFLGVDGSQRRSKDIIALNEEDLKKILSGLGRVRDETKLRLANAKSASDPVKVQELENNLFLIEKQIDKTELALVKKLAAGDDMDAGLLSAKEVGIPENGVGSNPNKSQDKGLLE